MLTVRVVINGHTRRAVLATAAALGAPALAGCGVLGTGPDQPTAPDPLQPVLDEAVALVAAYERAAVTQLGLATRLAPLADDHRAHVAELSRVIGRTPEPSASSAAPGAGTSLTDLRAAEQSAQRTAAASCRTSPASRAALVGSIAACRATHAEALR